MAETNELDEQREDGGAKPRAKRRGGRRHRGGIGRAEIQQLLDALAAAMITGGANIAAQTWEAPAFVLGDEVARSLATAEDIEGFLIAERERLVAREIASTRASIIRVDRATRQIVLATVQWSYLDASGAEVAEDRWTCALQRDARGAVRVRMAVLQGARPPTH